MESSLDKLEEMDDRVENSLEKILEKMEEGTRARAKEEEDGTGSDNEEFKVGLSDI